MVAEGTALRGSPRFCDNGNGNGIRVLQSTRKARVHLRSGDQTEVTSSVEVATDHFPLHDAVRRMTNFWDSCHMLTSFLTIVYLFDDEVRVMYGT